MPGMLELAQKKTVMRVSGAGLQGAALLRGHVALGRQSGYAWCCIGWFVASWFIFPTYWWRKPRVVGLARLFMWLKVWFHVFRPEHCEYLPCPIHCVIERVRRKKRKRVCSNDLLVVSRSNDRTRRQGVPALPREG